MKFTKSLFVVFFILLLAVSLRAQEGFHVDVIDKLAPARQPQIVYWFWQPNTLANAHYFDDVRNMAAHSPYSLAVFTEREGVDFYDYAKMHDIFAQTVAEGHKHHLRIGLQLWEFWSVTKARLAPTAKKDLPLGIKDAQALVTEGQVVLDAHGHGDYSVTCVNGRLAQPFHSQVLKVFAFRQTSPGYYAENSLRDITPSVKTIKADPASVTLAIDASPDLAGRTAYIMVAHYYDYPDLYNNVMIDKYREALEHYADIPFDATALDEFGSMMLTLVNGQPFRDRFYGRAFAEEYQKRTGTTLERALFDMRFAPEGKPEVRMAAINHYFDVMRMAPMRVEDAFYKMSKKIFGPNTFAGDHNTFHNTMRSDDIWRCGFNWWSTPREYGQSDEGWPYPQRMGLIMTHPEPLTYDMFYSKSLNAFLQKAFRDARWDGRIDYHAWNDYTGRWGIDLAETTKYAAITSAEVKIRLLNHFEPAAPKLSVLIVFGMPSLLNWFPDEAARNPWDINGSLGIEQKAMAVWNAHYPCALLPSDFIDSGQITFDAENHPMINGHRFDCMVFLDPQYAKESTLRFLESYAQHGGKLMLEGTATRDFDGQDIAGRFQKILAAATVRGFDINHLSQLGAQKDSLAYGAFMEDGSVIFTDIRSWRRNQPRPFKISLNGHEFAGKYEGVCAIKATPAGDLDKFACGGFSELTRDGKVIFSLPKAMDVLIRRNASGYQVTAVKPQ